MFALPYGGVDRKKRSELPSPLQPINQNLNYEKSYNSSYSKGMVLIVTMQTPQLAFYDKLGRIGAIISL